MNRTAAAALSAFRISRKAVTRADEAAEVKAAKAVLMATFNSTESPPTIWLVPISGHYRIADQCQGKMGRRSLLRRKNKWRIVPCNGDPLRSMETMHKIGLPSANAVALHEAEKAY